MRPGTVKMIHVFLISSLCIVADAAATDVCTIANGETNGTYIPIA